MRNWRPTPFLATWLARFGDLREFALPFATLDNLLFGDLELGQVGLALVKEVVGIFADRFGGSPAIERLGAFIPVANNVIKIADDDGVFGEIEKGGLFVEFFFGDL